MNWDDLKVFLAVARFESLSAAGRELKVDPATVGRRIARLEEKLGAPLFGKSPQGYAMTDAGQRLLTHAERAEQATAGAVEELAGQAGDLSGQIRIGAPDGCANYLLPQVCSKIMDENPNLEIQIVALPRVFNLSKREADMAIGVSPPTAGRLTVQKITDYKLHLAAARRYLIKHPKINSIEDLKGHRVIGYIPDLIFDKELDYLGEVGVDLVNLASNSVSVQFNWVRNACGVGVVHDFAIPFGRGIRKVLTDELSLTRSFYLIRHADDRRLERLNRFAVLLGDGLRTEVARLEAMT
ncbi:HTH-type transcriptional regulator GltR [Thalassovita gelatinovora]|uniref:HTH-type transcriptional regulator GltR n=1 Tax=Thalassovita gelatinovora TaxID=53501 RepID=A0A0P1FJW6_THAGE|nr:LysR family transcriptional regulator [Thalassovita gelatinovora]QIZ79327.1 LysR family transcriptional regulator [Thalassovita gelatinovora]CUH62580.1 HTH-type transcriptional regulator GltR [Thalassovita gelatinovora]SEQ06814.1 transcriptional regulator, LysR family [Thalassovita gelatinovora]